MSDLTTKLWRLGTRWRKPVTPTGYDNCPPSASHSCGECKRPQVN